MTDQEDTVRRYCWRTGYAGVMGDPCTECGCSHPPLEDQRQCWKFVAHGDHGHPCILLVGHEGPCTYTFETADE